jgi:hypothetical protein
MHGKFRLVDGLGSWRAAAFLAAATLACLASLISARPALATFHLVMIDEVYAGSAAAPQSSYVELQMYAPDQNLVHSHAVSLYDATGGLIDTFIFPSDLPGIGANQQTMLVGDDGVEAAFGVKPDLVDAKFNLPASGGAACWDDLDCVAWGSFAGSTNPDSGIPASGGGIPDGMSILRRISGGSCANLLDEADDTNDSDGDFAGAAPTPQSYATVPTPPSCTPPAPTPVVTLDGKPPTPTTATSATFEFHASPAATGFECRLDKGAYAACDAGSIGYAGPLSEGLHSFRVRGENANGVGAPANYSWTVDLTAPTASITSHPDDPSPGKSASFRYSSSEGGSKFECGLKPLESSLSPCNTQPKVYASLADGKYQFEVIAIDAAGNAQSSPTAFPWTVNNLLEDKTAPETTIDSRPPDPSSSPVASFTYSSNEPKSSFQCKLDGGNFNSCPATGVSYSGLQDGAHSFQVRAIDPSNNIDPSPAGYSFQVVLGGGPAALSNLALPTAKAKPRSRPNTRIASAIATTRDRTPTLRFGSSQAGAKFQCKLDGGRFVACRSPLTTKQLSYGPHVFQVRAVLAGLADSTPAKLTFKVLRKR